MASMRKHLENNPSFSFLRLPNIYLSSRLCYASHDDSLYFSNILLYYPSTQLNSKSCLIRFFYYAFLGVLLCCYLDRCCCLFAYTRTFFFVHCLLIYSISCVAFSLLSSLLLCFISKASKQHITIILFSFV